MSLFLPFRALGCITDDVPFAVQRRGAETFVTVAVGAAWQTFNCAKLLLVAASAQLPGPIAALAVSNDLTFAAVGTDIHVFRRVHRVGVWRGHAAPLTQLLPLGPALVTLARDGRILTWTLSRVEAAAAVSSAAGGAGDAAGGAAPLKPAPPRSLALPAAFTPTVMVHPDTYLNKVSGPF